MKSKDHNQLVETVFFNILVSYIRMLDETGQSGHVTEIIYALVMLLETVVQPKYLIQLTNAVEEVVKQAENVIDEEEEEEEIKEIKDIKSIIHKMMNEIDGRNEMSIDDIYKSIGWDK